MDVVEGRQRKVALAREWMQLGMFFEVLRGGCGRGTPEEGGIVRWMQSGMFLRFCGVDVVEGRQRKEASARAGTPSGDTTRAP